MDRTLFAACGLVLMAACADPPESVEAPANTKVAAAGSSSQKEVVLEPNMRAKPGGPELGVTDMLVTIYENPDRHGKKLGYLRLGMRMERGEQAASYDGCQGGFYNILPRGFVCVDDGATLDMEHAIMRAKLRGAARKKPLPYDYAFVRAIAPRYLRLPSRKEQLKYEMALKKHLRSFRRLEKKWNEITVGSNDVRILDDGVVLGPAPAEPPEMNHYQKFGGDGTGEVPWFLRGKRQIPNVSSYRVPHYAVLTNRIRRHAGVALIDAFIGDERDFALTTDLRLVPTSKLKPGRGSTFHGVELSEGWELPVGFVKKAKGAYEYERHKKRYKRKRNKMAYGTPVQLTGEAQRAGKVRWLETESGDWVRFRDLAVAAKPRKLPRHAKRGKKKWIEVAIQRQTLTLYRGSTPVFATMVSTGKDGIGDPKTTHSTPRGTFRIRDKHHTATMDSQTLGEEFELNDVPWVQYFSHGYALHAAYWHTEFGRARSHGCVNLSPIDAYRVFSWTDPPLPDRWHSVQAGEVMGEGTTVYIHW